MVGSTCGDRMAEDGEMAGGVGWGGENGYGIGVGWEGKGQARRKRGGS